MSNTNTIDINNAVDTLNTIIKLIPKNKKSSNIIMITSLAGLASVGIYKLVEYLNKQD
jgi:hypothetical protein